jgi:hypothetical protein
MYWKNKYPAKHTQLLATNPRMIQNYQFISFVITAGCGQPSGYQLDMLSDDEECIISKTVCKTTP